jgi:hypothetical protein
MLKKRALFVVSIALPGCFANVVALEPKAQAVKVVHESDKPLHCDVLGKITGQSRSNDEKAARQGAENDFRNQAAELNANFAFIEAERSGPVGTSSQHDVFIGGKALRCQTEEMEEAADKAAAAEREQKEKVAAEREQKEAEEKARAKDKKSGKK